MSSLARSLPRGFVRVQIFIEERKLKSSEQQPIGLPESFCGLLYPTDSPSCGNSFPQPPPSRGQDFAEGANSNLRCAEQAYTAILIGFRNDNQSPFCQKRTGAAGFVVREPGLSPHRELRISPGPTSSVLIGFLYSPLQRIERQVGQPPTPKFGKRYEEEQVPGACQCVDNPLLPCHFNTCVSASKSIPIGSWIKVNSVNDLH